MGITDQAKLESGYFQVSARLITWYCDRVCAAHSGLWTSLSPSWDRKEPATATMKSTGSCFVDPLTYLRSGVR